VLTSAIGADARNRILSLLRTLGGTRREVAALVAWELAPPALIGLLAGVALGLALPWLVLAAVDLRPYTGATTQPALAIDPLLVAGAAGAVGVAVIIAGAVSVAVARRRDPATTLRMGAD